MPDRLSEMVAARAIGAADIRHRFEADLPGLGGREVVSVHDLAPLRFPDEGHLSSVALRRLGRAGAVVALSRFSRNEIAEVTGRQDVDFVYPGVGEPHLSATATTDSDLERIGLRRPFVLHASGATQRKNLAGLAAAWKLAAPLLPGVTLAVAGGREQRRLAAIAGLERATVLERLSDAAMAGVMAAAAAVVVPSLYEGFGLPVLEGFAVGVPVVAVRAGSLPEAAGDCALLVDPEPEALARAIEQAVSRGSDIEDLVVRGRSRAREFSWAATARGYLAVYERLLTRA